MSLIQILLCRAAIAGFGLLLTAFPATAVPALLNHQGRMAVNGVNFEGTGLFKFALVNTNGTTTYWSNDGTSAAGSQPLAAVSLPVAKGLYAVLLGDTSFANMSALSADLFDNDDLRLRVWFNDGVTGFQQISPDHRLATAPYAMVAERVKQVMLSDIMASSLKPVVAWGDDGDGQNKVPPLTNVTAISAGSTHRLLLLDDGTVVAWGNGPAVPAGLAGVTNIAAGCGYNLARRNDGTVVAWGLNTFGQTAVPPGINDAVSVAAGERHSLALRANGLVVAWGNNTFNQTAVPPAATGVTAIACGYDHSLALKADGTVVAWGRNDAGQSSVPAGLTGVVSIAAGAYHSLAVKNDGTVVAWGWDLGQQCTVPDELSGVTKVAGGYSFSMALKTNGTIVAWGDNSDGQTDIPPGPAAFTAIAASASHAIALRSGVLPAQLARLDQENVFTDRVGINRAPSANALEVEGNASKTTAGAWLSNSDRRIKTEIQPITGALEKLDQVRLVDFRYTDAYRAAHPGIEDRRYLNVIAQEFATVFPNDVKSSGEKLPDGSPVLQVDTYPLTIYSAAAVQELHRENETLKEKLTGLEERLRKLEAALIGK
ncbi:MAG TPA: tail fiber domain-containing protein [Verrucomicrobiales bacterium]|nr:tail fiber domain-containing protein [Verrucomicrobiales bacterium]